MTILWDETPRLHRGARVFAPDHRMFGTVTEVVPRGWSDFFYRVRLDDNRTVLLARADLQTLEERAVRLADVQPVPGAPAHIFGVVIGGRS